MNATLMLSTRERAQVNLEWMRNNAKTFCYVQAKDGVWVPSCDLVQYEAGNRPWA